MSAPPLTLTPIEQRACDVYPRVRDAVLAMRELPDTRTAEESAVGEGAPSTYWRDELENIDYLFDATPRILRKLRQHSFHITNIRPHDYREKSDGRREAFTARLAALRALAGDELLVPESPALAGFGFDIDGQLFNVDTIKFYEVLAGMRLAGVFDPLRARPRQTVWEIGAGWGGFAYQFKTLFPNTTYVITDLPDLFLYSAVYLMTLFPDARVGFVGVDAPTNPAGWAELDFVFVGNRQTELVSAVPLSLTINMVSFQEMTSAQVRHYAAIAAAAGCPALYSLNRERSPFNQELTSVSAVVGELYALREIAVLDTEYTTATKRPPKAGRAGERPALAYRHMAGTLRPAGSVALSHETSTSSRVAVPVAPSAAPSVAPTAPRTVLGMTLYNNAAHLQESAESILAQTRQDFVLLMLDDASGDDTEQLARDYERRDPRVRYVRHAQRQGMVPTWKEVAERAARSYPGAEYFAWVSDHDRWHPEWLARMTAALDAEPRTVLAYPLSGRLDAQGATVDKEPRSFDTTGVRSPSERWWQFCWHGVGSGDMVYGLMRMSALRRAGTFRPALNPDRLLLAELTVMGEIRQVRESLWFRRQSGVASVARQRSTLFAGATPRLFLLPPTWQHAAVFLRHYRDGAESPSPVPLARLLWMLPLYIVASAWRSLRKTETSKAVGRGVDNLHWVKKVVKKGVRLSVYHTLIGLRWLRSRLRRFSRLAVYHTLTTMHALLGRSRRAGRRALYEILMFTHRAGLRGPKGGTR